MSRNRNTNKSAASKAVGFIIVMVVLINMISVAAATGSVSAGLLTVFVVLFVVSKVVLGVIKGAQRADGVRQDARVSQDVRTFGDLATDTYQENLGAFEAKTDGNARNRAGMSRNRARNSARSSERNRGTASYRSSSTVQVSGVNGWEGGRSRHLFHSEPFEQNDGLRHQSWPPRGGFPG